MGTGKGCADVGSHTSVNYSLGLLLASDNKAIKHPILWCETCIRSIRLKRSQGYDIRDDQAMSDLQTATHQKGAH
jgi:hypothetical protein